MDLLRAGLNASTLSAEIDMPKDTAYRQFREEPLPSRDAIVAAVADASTRLAWSGFAGSAERMAAAFGDAVAAERPFEAALVEAMAADIEAQFSSLGGPVGWIFHAAAITASPAWKGGGELSEDDRRLAEELLAIRAQFYENMSDTLLPILVAAMSLIGRRPRRGLDPSQILAVLHAMVDGTVLRRYIDPSALDSTLVAEAMYAVAFAFTEEGALVDPRRPQDPEGQRTFDRMVACAATSWLDDTSRTIETTATEAGVAAEAARLMFPSVADLADSVIWTQVLGAGPLTSSIELGEDGSTRPGAELAMTFGLLRRLRETADTLPGAHAVIRADRPRLGIGIRTQLEREVAEVLRCYCPGVEPGVTAVELVTAALAGEAGWSTVSSLMRVLDRRP
jgi:hypothetical protein